MNLGYRLVGEQRLAEVEEEKEGGVRLTRRDLIHVRNCQRTNDCNENELESIYKSH